MYHPYSTSEVGTILQAVFIASLIGTAGIVAFLTYLRIPALMIAFAGGVCGLFIGFLLICMTFHSF